MSPNLSQEVAILEEAILPVEAAVVEAILVDQAQVN